jgi:hypothetical protein
VAAAPTFEPPGRRFVGIEPFRLGICRELNHNQLESLTG